MNMRLVLILVLTWALCYCRNNVCSRWPDYLIMDISSKCYYNPDVGASPDEIINGYGYPFESFKVTTEDGYELRLMRIPRNNSVAVFLQHGISSTCLAWLSLGQQSLAFRLHDAGYDVWLGNFRGTKFSQRHVNGTVDDHKYWDFSFFEMGYYDLFAFMRHIKCHTKLDSKIIYIGHSMGTTTSYIYTILRKQEAENHLHALISLAPVAYMSHVDNMVPMSAIPSSLVEVFSKLFGIDKIGIHNNEQNVFSLLACLYGPTRLGCQIASLLVAMLTSNSLVPEALPVFVAQSPSASSMKTVIHYMQIMNAGGRFQNYDYGVQENRQRYGSDEPAAFNLSEINVPVYLLYGLQDTVATEKDVLQLYADLNTKKMALKIAQQDEVKFNHFDFVFSRQIDYLYDPLFTILSELSP